MYSVMYMKQPAGYHIVQLIEWVKQTGEIRPSVSGMRGMLFSELQENWSAEPAPKASWTHGQ